jgi:Asp-tRNA(Asn)/Glu-tRNA(Gln) amidotransferase A subunit family amidase
VLDPLAISPFTSGYELVDLYRKGDCGPVEVTTMFLDRISELNPELNAILTVAADGALAAARAAEDDTELDAARRPLHGVPLVVKDLEWTKGLRTTMGSLVYRDFVPDEDSIAVERLRNAGAIVIGKGNACEFGMHLETKNRLGPDTRNPWDLRLSAGGSSGGSAAAVAAGMAPIATGSDSAGSIGNPAALCGVVGVKPSHGRVPLWPDPGDARLFLDTGCITRTVRDAAMMLQVMAGPDKRDPVAIRDLPADFIAALDHTPAKLRIAWSDKTGGQPIDPEVRSVTTDAAAVFDELGFDVETATPKIEEPFFNTFMPLYLADEYVGFDYLLSQRPSDLDPDTRTELENARRVTLAEYVKALHRLWTFQAKVSDFFEEYDVLLTPNNPVPAVPALDPPSEIDGQPVPRDWTPHLAFLTPWNMAGNPWASVPCGFSREGLPIGLLIVAARGREDIMFAAAAAFENARPWRENVPPIGSRPEKR